MQTTKRFWKNLSFTLLLIAAIGLIFRLYSTENRRRIKNRNLSYAMDCAHQKADRVEGEFFNAFQRARNYAYFLGEILDETSNIPKILENMEKVSAFDAIRFIDISGTSHTSDGRVTDIRDRFYFTSGISGNENSTVIFDSRFIDETIIGFCVPVRQNGEIIGLLHALYFADSYLQKMLEVSFFGEAADAFLCTKDGAVVASSNARTSKSYKKPLPDELLEEGVIDTKTADSAWNAFRQGKGETGLICEEGKTDNLCVLPIPNSDYVLVQTFPQEVSKTLVADANRAGIMLEITLIVLFVLYILALLLWEFREKKALKKENMEMGYVTDGVRKLFSRFILVDFESDQYRYLTETKPVNAEFPADGKYGDLIGYLCSLLANESDREKLSRQLKKDRLIKKLGENGTSVQYEYCVNHMGAKEWWYINLVCLKRKDGKASKVLLLYQDITKFKEKELRAKEDLAYANRKERQYVAATMSDAVCMYEVNLTRDRIEKDIVCEMNGKQVSLLEDAGFGVPCSASRWFDACMRYVTEGSLEEYRGWAQVSQLLDCFFQGKKESVVDYWLDTPMGRKICVRQSCFMTREDETNDVMGMIIAKDITEQVRHRQEQMEALHEALQQAQHASHAKSAFLSNMSHDIRTPMNAIIGFTTIAISHIDKKEQVRDCLQKVLSSGTHLLNLINDILDMSRIESGKVQINEQECNISELTHNLVNIIQPQVKAKQMELFIDTFDVANEDVIADPLKLSQVFVNLLSNAVKYTPAGGNVTFRIMQNATFHNGRGDYVFIVKDNGIGMSPEFVEHIFEPFEREASTTKTGIQGTGLGMAITKNIIDMMEGKITVSSKKGEGSEFRVELSLKLQDVEKAAEKYNDLEGVRALVVDDDLAGCDSVCKMLKQMGLRAEWTASGREAVYRAKSAYNEGDPYHTYIIDWQMPEMNGIEAARRIRRVTGHDAPIIILTAYDWSEIEDEAKQAGVNAFCAKPLFLSDLKSALLGTHNLQEKEEVTAWTQADFNGKRILLVEDNEINREIACVILSEIGILIEQAPDGTDAVDMMSKSEENYYDAILMDVQMPVMDGYEAAKAIRALPRKDAKNIPIIAMTANAMEEDKETALMSGMNAHIAKPIDIDLFIETLGQFLV